jgi:hypothetical protein
MTVDSSNTHAENLENKSLDRENQGSFGGNGPRFKLFEWKVTTRKSRNDKVNNNFKSMSLSPLVLRALILIVQLSNMQ